jgi:hypothetical protein
MEFENTFEHTMWQLARPEFGLRPWDIVRYNLMCYGKFRICIDTENYDITLFFEDKNSLEVLASVEFNGEYIPWQFSDLIEALNKDGFTVNVSVRKRSLMEDGTYDNARQLNNDEMAWNRKPERLNLYQVITDKAVLT